MDSRNFDGCFLFVVNFIRNFSGYKTAILFAVALGTGCSYSARKSLRLLKEAETIKYDVIIVPGVPLEDGKWSRTMKGRIYWSKFLFEKGIAKNVMYSGAAVYTPYEEGKVMALYAEALGIPHEHIYTETKAEHSTENAFYGYRKAQKLGFNTIAIASDPFQTKMLKSFAHKKLNKNIGLIPMVYDSMQVPVLPTTDPVVEVEKAYVENFIALPEREGFWKRLRGTRGLSVDTSAYR